MDELTSKQRMELTQAFKNFDLDGNGFIDKSEIQAILAQHSVLCSEQQIERIMQKIDRDRNGYWDLDEFIEFMVRLRPLSKE